MVPELSGVSCTESSHHFNRARCDFTESFCIILGEGNSMIIATRVGRNKRTILALLEPEPRHGRSNYPLLFPGSTFYHQFVRSQDVCVYAMFGEGRFRM